MMVIKNWVKILWFEKFKSKYGIQYQYPLEGIQHFNHPSFKYKNLILYMLLFPLIPSS
jgi:hypothetical protein